VAKIILVSLSKNTKRMSWSVPTLSPLLRLPPSNRRNARSRFAPPAASGTTIVSSETLPRRAPTRPALSMAGGGVSETCELISRSAFSSAFFPRSGASANNSRNCRTFSAPACSFSALVDVGACVLMSAFSFGLFQPVRLGYPYP
jgi:hypothetical protein